MVILSTYCNGQIKKKSIDFDRYQYVKALDTLLYEINDYTDISWIYFRPVKVDTNEYDFWTQSEMEVLIDNELHNLEFSETDFNLTQIKIRNDRNLIEYKLSQQKDTVIYFQDLRDSLGVGVLVSVPYSEKEIKYIDFQLIDWNVDCGTGNYFRKEMK